MISIFSRVVVRGRVLRVERLIEFIVEEEGRKYFGWRFFCIGVVVGCVYIGRFFFKNALFLFFFFEEMRLKFL